MVSRGNDGVARPFRHEALRNRSPNLGVDARGGISSPHCCAQSRGTLGLVDVHISMRRRPVRPVTLMELGQASALNLGDAVATPQSGHRTSPPTGDDVATDPGIIETSIPFRLDDLRWSGFHTRVVLALG